MQIAEDEVKTAKDEFRGLSEMVLWSLPKSLLTPLLNKLRLEINSNVSAKQWLFKADPALRNVICKEALQWRSPTCLSQVIEFEFFRQNSWASNATFYVHFDFEVVITRLHMCKCTSMGNFRP